MFEDLENAWIHYVEAKQNADKRYQELVSMWEEFRAFCMRVWKEGGFPEVKFQLKCGDVIISSKKVICNRSREILTEIKVAVLEYINDQKTKVDTYYK